jgi:hypothetical protein
VKQEDDWVGMLAGIPGTLLVWLLAIYLTFRKRGRLSLGPSWRSPSAKVHAARELRSGSQLM